VKVNFKKIFKIAAANLLAVVIGIIVGAFISVSYGLHFWLPGRIAALPSGFGALFGGLALIMTTILLFGILGIVVGGILGVIIYQLLKRL
jgi:uncharacterized PurR-regulated membrane protein YhhQ (DUF165 family)